MKNKSNKEIIEKLRKIQSYYLEDGFMCDSPSGDGEYLLTEDVENFLIKALEQKEREVREDSVCLENCCVQRREYSFSNKKLDELKSEGK